MTFLLHYSTPTEKHRHVLRTGEYVRVGTSHWNELTLPACSELAPEHFSMSYQEHLVVSVIGESVLLLDGNSTNSFTVTRGSKFCAGKCVFCLEQAFAPEHSYIEEPNGNNQRNDLGKRWDEKPHVLESVGMSQESRNDIEEFSSPTQAVHWLISNSRVDDALRLIAGCLDTQARIQWCLESIKSAVTMGPKASELATAWCQNPSDETRSSAAGHIDWKNQSCPGTWLLAAISWTGGSISPPDAPPVTPPSRMVISAVIASLQLACCHVDPTEFRTECCERGFRQLLLQLSREDQYATRS